MRTRGDEGLNTKDPSGRECRVGNQRSTYGQPRPPTGRSFELELRLSGSAVALEKLWKSAVAAGEQTVSRRLTSITYDTTDLRLRRRGLTLRVFQDGEDFVQTITAVGDRPRLSKGQKAWSAPINGPQPNLKLLENAKLRKRIGLIVASELRPIFTSDVIRRKKFYRVDRENTGPTEIEAVLDIGEHRCEAGTEAISEIELKLLQGTPLALRKVAARLHQVSPCQFQPLSRSQRGFALALGERPTVAKATLPRFTTDTSVEEGFERVLANCLKHWLANHAAVLDGSDTEGVHQMRVALRRMRAALTIFKSLLPAEDLEWLKREAGSLTDGLGDARDWDVFDEELLHPVIAARTADTSLRILQETVTEERRLAQERARMTLRSPAYLEFLLELSIWLENRGWRRDGAASRSAASRPGRRMIDHAGEVLRRRHKQAVKLGRGFETLPDETLHRLRLSLKKLRYTTEFFASLYGKRRTRPYLEALRQLQGDLGFLNDVAVAEIRLRDLCGNDGGGNAGALQMAFGTVVGWHTHALFQIRPRIAKDWTAFTKAKPFWKQ